LKRDAEPRAVPILTLGSIVILGMTGQGFGFDAKHGKRDADVPNQAVRARFSGIRCGAR
jgi:hypothetical protein